MNRLFVKSKTFALLRSAGRSLHRPVVRHKNVLLEFSRLFCASAATDPKTGMEIVHHCHCALMLRIYLL
jgi:hypothetical protein